MKAELIDHMGSDLTVVNAARVSFDKESDWAWELGNDFEGFYILKDGHKTLTEKDEKLIKYLANHNHWTPFSHCTITLRETVPLFVARQRFKHMVGFTYNEVSRRYVDDEPEFFQPKTWRARAENKKQGSGESFQSDWKEHQTFKELFELENLALFTYKTFLDRGIAPEQARMVLPQSMYTSYYVTGSLYAFARAYNLRSDPHAQQEIQELAAQWNELLRPLYPVSWEALTNGRK